MYVNNHQILLDTKDYLCIRSELPLTLYVHLYFSIPSPILISSNHILRVPKCPFDSYSLRKFVLKDHFLAITHRKSRSTVLSNKNGVSVRYNRCYNLQLRITFREIDQILLHPFSTRIITDTQEYRIAALLPPFVQ